MPGAYIWGWDYDAGDWVKCRVDDTGKLIIGSGTVEVEQDTPADLQATVTPAAGAEFLNYPRIPSGATQIALGANADGNTVEIHEVDTEVTLYLTHSHIGMHNAAGATGAGLMQVTNAGNAEQYRLHSSRILDGTGVCDGATYIPPIEIPAGWKIKIASGLGNLDVYGFIHGYEV